MTDTLVILLRVSASPRLCVNYWTDLCLGYRSVFFGPTRKKMSSPPNMSLSLRFPGYDCFFGKLFFRIG